ncbi:MAG: hypothetical protein AAGD34_22355, partial [Pseudomonadota bacterium]
NRPSEPILRLIQVLHEEGCITPVDIKGTVRASEIEGITVISDEGSRRRPGQDEVEEPEKIEQIAHRLCAFPFL